MIMNSNNKLIMLNEYEKQITNLFYQFKNNKINLTSLINYFNRLNEVWKIARVDIKNFGTSENSVEFLEYGKNITVFYPAWYKDNKGRGSKIETEAKTVNIMFKCISKGEINIILKGVDFRDFFSKNKRIPIYTNFKEFIVNDELIEEDSLNWHNKAYAFKKACENEEVITARFEIETLFDYFPALNKQLNQDMSQTEVETCFDKIKLYIQNEKHTLNNLPDF